MENVGVIDRFQESLRRMEAKLENMRQDVDTVCNNRKQLQAAHLENMSYLASSSLSTLDKTVAQQKYGQSNIVETAVDKRQEPNCHITKSIHQIAEAMSDIQIDHLQLDESQTKLDIVERALTLVTRDLDMCIELRDLQNMKIEQQQRELVAMCVQCDKLRRRLDAQEIGFQQLSRKQSTLASNISKLALSASRSSPQCLEVSANNGRVLTQEAPLVVPQEQFCDNQSAEIQHTRILPVISQRPALPDKHKPMWQRSVNNEIVVETKHDVHPAHEFDHNANVPDFHTPYASAKLNQIPENVAIEEETLTNSRTNIELETIAETRDYKADILAILSSLQRSTADMNHNQLKAFPEKLEM